ncbi:MAG: PDDEXK nuclease domain-containing protein [Oscillospiraceae bacterium]|nr:PDDEXK nuclease domain-containing protein [Oscillospiraceae bacterium]
MNTSEYMNVIESIKDEIKASQYKAVLNVNRELIVLYYNIGKVINEHKVWGNRFIDNLAQDIKVSFPNTTGYSVRNLKYMAKFASMFPDIEIVQAVLAQITWYHNIALMDKVKDVEQYIWYAEKVIDNGWSRNVLVHQIESGLYEHQVLTEKVANFETRLATPQSELAIQTMKDPYVFDFIPFKEDMVERDIERALVQDITKLLLELGTGFAFLGNQYHLTVGGDDFYIDLLFYNLNLRCYVVIELKTGDFQPEYVGQLNFYLSAVDGILKKPEDQPSIGLLLCKSKNNLVAEYALKDMSKPMGVSEYRLTSDLPNELKCQLPTAEDIRSRISSKNANTEHLS